MNKQDLSVFAKLVNGEAKGLLSCYKYPSLAKQRAYARCFVLAMNRRAVEFGITGYNAQRFTFGFIYKSDGYYKLWYSTGASEHDCDCDTEYRKYCTH